jgi:hypothetical protein
VETCRVKCLTAGNGAMVGVDGTGFVNWRWNRKSLWNKIEDPKRKNKGLEDQLRAAVAGSERGRRKVLSTGWFYNSEHKNWTCECTVLSGR